MLIFITKVIRCRLHDYSIGSLRVSLWIPVTSMETVELKSYLFMDLKKMIMEFDVFYSRRRKLKLKFLEGQCKFTWARSASPLPPP